MSQLVLDRNARLLLQAKAHHLDPVVLLGGNGLTEAVIKEVDRALTAHGLIKVKVPSDDREERTAIFEELADKLGAAKITQIGKLLVLFRPIPEKEETEETLGNTAQFPPCRSQDRRQSTQQPQAPHGNDSEQEQGS